MGVLAIMNVLLFSALCVVVGYSYAQPAPDNPYAWQNTGRDLESADHFPPYYRVEVEIVKFENPNSVDLVNAWCDTVGHCDTGISAYLDMDKALKPFISAAKAKVIFDSTDNDSPKINAVVNKDVCGGASSQVTLRAYVYDMDNVGVWQTIDDIDCNFFVSPNDVADTATSSKWGPQIQCKAKYRDQDHRLFARIRAYKTDETTCHIDHAQLMDLQSSKSATPPKPHTPGVHEIISLELQLVQLKNPNGKTYEGSDCDVGSPCDPFFLAKLETENSLWKWPGVDGENGFTQVGNVWDNNSPQLNQKMHRKICGGALNWVNMRVQVKDGDPVAVFSDYTLIESFQCIFQFDYSIVAASEAEAEWTPTVDCKPNHPGHDITLQYRMRAFDTELKDC